MDEQHAIFHGTATFHNNTRRNNDPAPHFNVNLGNTASGGKRRERADGRYRGRDRGRARNAAINGTIISMCDTTQWSDGYVTMSGRNRERI